MKCFLFFTCISSCLSSVCVACYALPILIKQTNKMLLEKGGITTLFLPEIVWKCKIKNTILLVFLFPYLRVMCFFLNHLELVQIFLTCTSKICFCLFYFILGIKNKENLLPRSCASQQQK